MAVWGGFIGGSGAFLFTRLHRILKKCISQWSALSGDSEYLIYNFAVRGDPNHNCSLVELFLEAILNGLMHC